MSALSSTFVTVDWRLGLALVVLVAVAGIVGAVGRLGHTQQILVAAGRAAIQLAAVSVLIGAIVGSVVFTIAFIAGMYAVAARTSGRRLTPAPAGWWASVPIVVASAPVAAGLLLGGVLPFNALAVIPVTGILIGGGMTATSLAGRRALDELFTRRGEVEAALSLGFSDRDAALEICRPTASQALIPALDQLRYLGAGGGMRPALLARRRRLERERPLADASQLAGARSVGPPGCGWSATDPNRRHRAFGQVALAATDGLSARSMAHWLHLQYIAFGHIGTMSLFQPCDW